MERNRHGNTRSRQASRQLKNENRQTLGLRGGIAENWGKRCFKKLTTALFPSLPQATTGGQVGLVLTELCANLALGMMDRDRYPLKHWLTAVVGECVDLVQSDEFQWMWDA